MVITDAVRELILRNKSTTAIRNLAVEQGMALLRQDGAGCRKSFCTQLIQRLIKMQEVVYLFFVHVNPSIELFNSQFYLLFKLVGIKKRACRPNQLFCADTPCASMTFEFPEIVALGKDANLACPVLPHFFCPDQVVAGQLAAWQ